MKHGNYQKNTPGRKRSRSSSLLLALAIVLLTISAGSTIAYLMTNSAAVTNSFVPGQVSCEVVQVKNGYAVKNTSNTTAYLRATYAVNWMDSSGNVLGTRPIEGTDYSVAVLNGWTEAGGIWYYNPDVAVNGQVNFIQFDPISQSADGYTVTVEVVAEAIQSKGMNATSAQDAWAKAKSY